MHKELEKHHIEYLKLLNKWDESLQKLEKSTILNRKKLEIEYDNAQKVFNDFSKSIYALKIFTLYSEIKPNLIRIKTNTIHKWNDVFKSSFAELDNLDKSILVGLIENNGGYKFQ